MLTAEQRESFYSTGVLHVPGAIPDCAAADMEDFVWSCLRELHGIERNDPSTWQVAAPWGGLKDHKDAPVLQSIGSDTLCGLIDELLGADNWKKPRHWGGFLVKFPDTQPDDWHVPSGLWHVDAHFTYDPATAFGLRVFTFLSDVPPRSGGTLIVTRSHGLVARFVGRLSPDEQAAGFASLRDRFLSMDAWFQRLTDKDDRGQDRVSFFLDNESIVDGVAVRVEELCGRRGDVVLMHPWVVHAASPHTGTGPRFVLAKDLFAKSPRPRADFGHAAAIS